MGRLFLKFYSILAIAGVVYFVGIVNLNSILKGTLEQYTGYLSHGTFSLLENRLINAPQQQWPAILDEMNQGDSYPVRILPIDGLQFSADIIERLQQGNVIHQRIYQASYNYRRLANTDWVLEIPLEQSTYLQAQRISNSTFNLIEMNLRELPQHGWIEKIKALNAQFNFPLTLVQQPEVAFLNTSSDKPFHGEVDIQQRLDNGDVVVQGIDEHQQIFFRRIVDTPYIIQMGPFDQPLTLNYLPVFLVLILALLVALAVLSWVYPLWRDLKQLSFNAVAFGQGNLSIRTPLSRHSVLHRMADAFNSMADRIQGLISSHKELTNAVSHELRTPIARLRFGIEMLESSTDETARKRFMQSMNNDIDELDQLVAELLTFARFDRDRPNMAFQRQSIKPWLDAVIRQATTNKNNIVIEFRIEDMDLTYARFEPRLLARALSNLLQNARRYAKSRIEVKFTRYEDNYQMIVDDDGPGIPENKRDSVFEAFSRLDESRDRETGGFGLGLAIVQRISHWHGGSVHVVDSPLGGARFVISWPVNDVSQQ